MFNRATLRRWLATLETIWVKVEKRLQLAHVAAASHKRKENSLVIAVFADVSG